MGVIKIILVYLLTTNRSKNTYLYVLEYLNILQRVLNPTLFIVNVELVAFQGIFLSVKFMDVIFIVINLYGDEFNGLVFKKNIKMMKTFRFKLECYCSYLSLKEKMQNFIATL